MDERLEKLVIEAQQHTAKSQERQLAVTRLVDEILRSRKIARPPIGQPLLGIYKEIYEQVKQQLLHNLASEVDKYNPKFISVREWLNAIRNQAFKTVLNDVQLKNLATEAQRQPPQSELRQYALGELVEAIRLSGRLCHPHREKFSPQFYQLLYEEAVNKTLIYVCRKIDNYDPERGEKKFMNWVNFRLDRAVLESANEFNEPRLVKIPSLTELDNIVHQEEPISLFENVREYIEADPKNIFKQAYVRNRPDANFRDIALARFAGETWEDVSAKFGIPIPTLSSFFQRCCEKFRSQFS